MVKEVNKDKAIKEVVDLIRQGFRTRGKISMIGVTGGREKAIVWAEEAGQVVETPDGTLILANEINTGAPTWADFDLTLVEVKRSELNRLGLEARCSVGCKLPIEQCLQLHWWSIDRKRLKYRGDRSKEDSNGHHYNRYWTGPADLVEKARKVATNKFHVNVKPIAGKYDIWLLMVGDPLPQYLASPPEEPPDDYDYTDTEEDDAQWYKI